MITPSTRQKAGTATGTVPGKFGEIRKRLLEFLILKVIAADRVYVADMLRTFGSLGVDALLLDEGSAPESGLIHPEAYRSVLNVADHYGWPVLIRTDAAAAWLHGSIPGVTAWLGPAPVDVTSGRWGVVATAGFWDGDNPAPDAGFVLVPVPAQADPEVVMKRVRALA